MEVLLVTPLLTVFLTIVLWAIVQEWRGNHVVPRLPLKKSKRTGTLAAIDEMHELDGATNTYALTADRVGGWRGRLLRALIETFRGGQLPVSDYETQVERVVAFTEPEALTAAAKQAARAVREREQRETKRKLDAERDQAWQLAKMQMRRLLDIDITPYKDTFRPSNAPFGGVTVDIGDVRYVVQDNGRTVRDGKVWYIEVEKACPYAGEQGCYTGRIYAYDAYNRHIRITDLVTLGTALESLESKQHCHSPWCKLRHGGYTEEQIRLAHAEERRKEEERKQKEQEERLRTGWVDHTGGLVYGPGGRLVGSLHGRTVYPWLTNYYGGYGYGFSHVPHDIFNRPMHYRDVVMQESNGD